MSPTAVAPIPRNPTAVASPRRLRTLAGSWARAAVAVALVAASAGWRARQQARVDRLLGSGLAPPFLLADLPLELGDWRGRDDVFDPTIARAAGASDHAYRTYVDRRTGATLALFLIYGRATDVFIHAPELCYPKAGYEHVDGPRARDVVLADGRRIPFAASAYVRGEGGSADRQKVYHTWRFAGQWATTMPPAKRVERMPGMFKVHLARPMAEAEPPSGAGLEEGDPCQEFLRLLIPEMERRLAAASPPL